MASTARRREEQPVRAPSDARAWQWRLVVFVLALAIVVMHHVAGAHEHAARPSTTDRAAPAPAVEGAISSVGSVMEGMVSAGRHTGAGTGTHTLAVTDAATRTDAPPRSGDEVAHEGHGMDMTMLLHLCLAILGTALLVVALALLASWWRAGRHLVSPPSPTGSPSRAPPVPQRLAQLQVLRL